MARIGETDAAGQVSSSSNVSSPKATETNETNGNQPIEVGEKSEATKREEKVNNLVAEFNNLKKDDGNVDLEAFLSTIEDKEVRKAVENELKAQEKAQKEADKIEKEAEREANEISKRMEIYTTSGKNTNFYERTKRMVALLMNLTDEEICKIFNRHKTDAPEEVVRDIQFLAPDPYVVHPIIENEKDALKFNKSSGERNKLEQAIQKDIDEYNEAPQQDKVNKDAPSYTGEPEKTAPENLGPQEKTAPAEEEAVNRDIIYMAPDSEDYSIKLSDEDYERFTEIEDKRANGTANAQDFLDEFYISSKNQPQKNLTKEGLELKAKFFLEDITDPAEKEKFQKQIGMYIYNLINAE